LTDQGLKLVGYVIMPNHLHLLIYYPKTEKTFNSYIANGKRFMAYEIVKRLQRARKSKVLKELEEGVTEKERREGKKHRVFNPSFDSKICYGQDFIEQKLDYIHANPISGKWNLVNDFTDYDHSSARFYELGKKTEVPVTNFLDLIF
jgi:REP element-mobilizing transposase RayT